MPDKYPLVFYPAKITSALQQTNRSAKVVETPLPPPFALPEKSTFVRQAPWYALIAFLLLVAAVIYKIATIPLIASLVGAMIGVGIKYAIDYPKWKKKLKIAQQRNNAAPKVQKTIIPAAYPDWKEIISFEKSSVKSVAQQGLSEEFFINHLLSQNFPATFGHQYPHYRNDRLPYSSDIEIVLADKGLAVQIEIDEPYDGKSGRPHHCCDNKADTDRNEFFKKRDWVIIRFAEEQVINQPLACCHFIARQINALTGDNQYVVTVGDAEELRAIACWTTKQSLDMAKARYRLKYLTKAGLWKEKK